MNRIEVDYYPILENDIKKAMSLIRVDDDYRVVHKRAIRCIDSMPLTRDQKKSIIQHLHNVSEIGQAKAFEQGFTAWQESEEDERT